ncbi:uncharacterized protein LOC142345204 [Convolutriloba macropyga]|uniref:uncharacterized protein LOC142345204 n=1 Tax=Convolutriloba macropyga TaxID=536237 RepID=UPI003F51E296
MVPAKSDYHALYPYRPRKGDNEYITSLLRKKRTGLVMIVFSAYSKMYYIVNSIILLVLVVHYKAAAIIIRNKFLNICSKLRREMKPEERNDTTPRRKKLSRKNI